jgi:hypothetical protein
MRKHTGLFKDRIVTSQLSGILSILRATSKRTAAFERHAKCSIVQAKLAKKAAANRMLKALRPEDRSIRGAIAILSIREKSECLRTKDYLIRPK